MRRIVCAGLMVVASAAIAIDTAVPVTHAALPSGFSDTLVADAPTNPLSGPTGITAMADGRALITEKAGKLRILAADGTLVAADALSLTVCTNSEEGMLGAVADPSFATNGYIYVYYTLPLGGSCNANGGAMNRVSRFTMTGNTVDPASELVLLDKMYIPAGNHNGGDLHFGADGYLYVSVGDGGSNPRGSGPSAAHDLSLLNGKIMRIGKTPDSVPPDNPFVGVAGAKSCWNTGLSTTINVDKCTQIYAYGLRNPYRFAFDPNDGNATMFINDVGQSTWEEVDKGGKGLDYGWDIREGFCQNGVSTNCTPTPAGYTDPLTAYNHSIGCTYITAGAFVPNGLWPAQYDDSYLFGDGGCGKIWQRTAAGVVDYNTPFATTSGVIVDMAFVTQGSTTPLYYVTNSDSKVHKILYSSAAPVFTAKLADVTATAPNGSNVAVSFPSPVATSNGSSVPVTCAPASGSTFSVGTTTVTCTATNGAGTATTSFAVIVSARSVATDHDFIPLTPFRLADTRAGGPTGDGLFVGGGPIQGGATLQLRVQGRGGVAADAASASLNVTSVGSVGTGFLTVFPCGSTQPTASSLNYPAGSIVSNAVITKIGAGGNVCIFASVTTDLVVDVGGAFPFWSSLSAINPFRVLDTRAGQPTSDGVGQGAGLRPDASVTVVKVAGRAGVPANAGSVVLNVTATEAAGPGYITVYPCGSQPPTASNINVPTDGTVPNLTVTKIGTDGSICIYNQIATQLVVDVDGYFPASTKYTALLPARVLDTRIGFPTTDGVGSGGGPVATTSVTTVPVRGRGGVAAGATAVVLNVTVTDPQAAGFLTVYPCGATRPLASNVNFAPGQTVANAAVVALAGDGTVCIFASQPTQLVADVNGSFAP
ncbi:MAG: hypothetical protein JWL72_4835 [Ilumatobacteraceae bacterium]|nr:hypothetical protein [Ilumatobacteraceae bacterium]